MPISKNDYYFGDDITLPKSIDIQKVIIPEYVANAPGMISLNERKMLYYFSSRYYLGEGFIVDGGSFFGASVCAIAHGLFENPKFDKDGFIDTHRDRKPIISYEIGYLPAPKSDKIDKKRVYGNQEYILGENFIHILKKSVSPYNDIVYLDIGDFLQKNWDKKDDIELCFIDHAKSATLNKHISSTLYPSLREGSILIHQDFYFDRLPWIKCTMGHISDYFEWIGQIHTSSIYKCVRRVPEEKLKHDPYLMSSTEEKLQLHKKSHWDFLPRKRLFSLEISYSYLLALCGRNDDGLNHLDWVSKEYSDILESNSNSRVNRVDRAKRQISINRMNM